MSHGSPEGAGRGGFTLLEITITIAILGVIMTIVYGVFAQTLSAKARTEEVSDEFTSARSALGRITQDLSNARVTGGSGTPAASGTPGTAQAQPTPTPASSKAFLPQLGLFLGRPRSEQRMPVDDLAFTATIRRPTAITYGATDSGIVHYFLARLPETESLGLFREAIYSLSGEAFDPDEPNPAYTTLVLPNVIGLQFRFFDGKEWGGEWDSTNSRDFAAAPFAVEVTLTASNPRGEAETYQTAVDLPLLTKNRAPEPAAASAGATR